MRRLYVIELTCLAVAGIAYFVLDNAIGSFMVGSVVLVLSVFQLYEGISLISRGISIRSPSSTSDHRDQDEAP